jgi:ubiquinone/menaquinone biosynthesis C-methylase UbiE
MNAEKMDFAEPFDIMWVVAALTHFPHQKQFLESTSRFLKKNGKLIIFDWTVNKELTDITHDKDVQAVREGMLMAAIYSNETYVNWLIEDGFHLTYEEDVTAKTIKTWDINLSIIRRPLIKELIMAIIRGEMLEIRTFMKARSAIKLAMQNGKVKSYVIIAEKS